MNLNKKARLFSAVLEENSRASQHRQMEGAYKLHTPLQIVMAIRQLSGKYGPDLPLPERFSPFRSKCKVYSVKMSMVKLPKRVLFLELTFENK